MNNDKLINVTFTKDEICKLQLVCLNISVDPNISERSRKMLQALSEKFKCVILQDSDDDTVTPYDMKI